MTNAAPQLIQPIDGNALVAANVRAELAYSGASQGDLAHVLNLSDMAVTRRISDKYNAEFSATEIAIMANYFGIDPGELFKTRERRAGAAVGKVRNLYMLEPSSSTVEDRRFGADWVAPVTQLRSA